MRIRDVQLEWRRAMVGNAGQWTLPVNLVDPVTEFKIWVMAGVDDAGSLEDQCLPYVIEEVAVIDGSEVIQSMNGAEAIALYMYDHGKSPMHWHQELTGMNNYWSIPLTFGRWLTDPEWIFDPTRFRNPQIRIQWNLSAIHAANAAKSWEDQDLSVSIWAKVMEEGATPRGYLMSKELKEFASLAAGDEITYLPTDFPIRKVMIRAYKNCGAQSTAITNIKISQDEDKFIPVDLNSHDFIFLHYDWFDEMEFNLKLVRDDLEEDEHFGGTYAHLVAVSAEDDVTLHLRGAANNCVYTDLVTGDTPGGTDAEIWARTFTRTPFDTFCYPFGDQQDPADWLDVRRIGNLRLILTQGSIGYTEQIVVQQAHPY